MGAIHLCSTLGVLSISQNFPVWLCKAVHLLIFLLLPVKRHIDTVMDHGIACVRLTVLYIGLAFYVIQGSDLSSQSSEGV